MLRSVTWSRKYFERRKIASEEPEHTSEPPVLGHARKRRMKPQSRTVGFILYQSLYAPLIFVKAVYKQLIILGAMFAWDAAVFSYYEHLPLLDSFLASVSTITTIGLYVPNGGNFLTLDRTEAGLLIIMIIISVGAAASILQGTVNTVVNGDLARGEAERVRSWESLRSWEPSGWCPPSDSSTSDWTSRT